MECLWQLVKRQPPKAGKCAAISIQAFALYLLFQIEFGIMALEILSTLEAVFEKADTPMDLRHWLQDILGIVSIPDLLGYVQKDQYEREWRDLVHGAFPIVLAQEAREATEATEGSPAQPARLAVEAFDDKRQRILVSRMRSTYKVALGVDQAAEESLKATKQDTYQADLEQPLDPETRRRLKTSWAGIHNWQQCQA